MFSALIVSSLVSVAFATVFVTDPVASTTDLGGKPAKVTWMDDGNAPTLEAFGPAKISIYAGNADQQTSLQLINGSIDVSKFSSCDFTPNPTIGPNSAEYFIRVESLGLKVNSSIGEIPALAFSSKFTLNNMTGNFSASVLAEISGQSTAPLASQPSSGTSDIASTPSLTGSSTSGSPTSSSSTTSATATSSSGAKSLKAGWAGIVFGAVVGFTMF